MRLGEIKNIINEATDPSHNIVLENEPIYGGQAFNVTNFGRVMSALDILAIQTWNELDDSIIESIESKYGAVEKAQLSQEDFNELNSYINSINGKLPMYYSIIDTIAKDQDEKVINLRLPSETNTLKDLADLNKRLNTLLELFNIDGGYQFSGFDTGTNWYVISVIGLLSHRCLILCLQAAQEILKTRKIYYESEDAKLSYKVHLSELAPSNEYTEKGFKDFNEKKIDLLLLEKIDGVINELKNTNGRTKEELHTRLVSATKGLIKELGSGVEFHLSLNPPEYAKEISGELVIDYNSLRKVESVEQLQIEAPAAEEVEPTDSPE